MALSPDDRNFLLDVAGYRSTSTAIVAEAENDEVRAAARKAIAGEIELLKRQIDSTLKSEQTLST